MISVVYEIVDGLSDQILRPVVEEMGHVVGNVLRLAFRVDDKEEAVQGFQQERAQELRVQQGRLG